VRLINREIGNRNVKFDSIICVAGGYTPGSIRSPKIFDELKEMHESNTVPAILSGYLASKYIG